MHVRHSLVHEASETAHQAVDFYAHLIGAGDGAVERCIEGGRVAPCGKNANSLHLWKISDFRFIAFCGCRHLAPIESHIR